MTGMRGIKPSLKLAVPQAGASSKVVKVEAGAQAAAFEDKKKLDDALTQYTAKNIQILSIDQFEHIDSHNKICSIEKSLLGEGSYGNVYRMRGKVSREVVAVKRLKKNKFAMTEEIYEKCTTTQQHDEARTKVAKSRSRLLIELAVLQEFATDNLKNPRKHPALLHFRGMIHDEEYVYMFMELFSGSDLYDYVSRKWKGVTPILPYSDIVIIAHTILKTLQFLHREIGIIHRDLKLENVLIRETRFSSTRFDIKLIDFGQAKYTKTKSRLQALNPGGVSVSPGPGSQSTGLGGATSPAISVTPIFGTLCYLPMEALKKLVDKTEWMCEVKHVSKIDVYQCGMIMFILLCGVPESINKLANTTPQTIDEHATRQEKLLEEVGGDYFSVSLNKLQGEYKSVASLVGRMMSVEAGDRPSPEECIELLETIMPSLHDYTEEILSCTVLTAVAATVCGVVYGARGETCGSFNSLPIAALNCSAPPSSPPGIHTMPGISNSPMNFPPHASQSNYYSSPYQQPPGVVPAGGYNSAPHQSYHQQHSYANDPSLGYYEPPQQYNSYQHQQHQHQQHQHQQHPPPQQGYPYVVVFVWDF